jgi:hypothetical protein
VPSEKFAHFRQAELQLSGNFMELSYPVVEKEEESISEFAICKFTIGGARGLLVCDVNCQETHTKLQNVIYNLDAFDHFCLQNNSEMFVYFKCCT